MSSQSQLGQVNKTLRKVQLLDTKKSGLRSIVDYFIKFSVMLTTFHPSFTAKTYFNDHLECKTSVTLNFLTIDGFSTLRS